MGDLGIDTTVVGTNGVYTATLSREWEIWGPMGGYLASFALRSAGLHCGLARPASCVGHFLGVASFDEPITITCETLRVAKTAHSVRASISQGDRAIFELMVWGVVDQLQGLDHADDPMPEAAHWEILPNVQQRLEDQGETYTPFYPFWANLEERPPVWRTDWNDRASGEESPRWQQWLRFVPTSTFIDPWIDACRLLVLVDIGSWPAAQAHHNTQEMMAPSIDIACAFHRIDPSAAWIFLDAHSPAASDGIVASHQRLWNDRGDLLASGISQLLCRPVPKQVG